MSEDEQTPAADGDEEGYGTALSELLACENLAQTASWVARWTATFGQADAVSVWTPDVTAPIFVCTGVAGDGLGKTLRRDIPRGDGLVRALVRDRVAVPVSGAGLLTTEDPWVKPYSKDFGLLLAIPLVDGEATIGLLSILYRDGETNPAAALQAIEGFVPDATGAISRAIRADRKTSGMLHAIERLTNLYDLSKAFGSTIEWQDLTKIIARKAVDFGNGEVASLWILEEESGEVSLGSTAVNENYDVKDPPAAVGSTVIGDLLASQSESFENGLAEDHPLRHESEGFEIHSVLAVPLFEEEALVGAIIVVNKRGRHPQFNDSDRELLVDVGHQAVRALRNARRYEAEKKVEELDALLAVSREITSTLDLDRVMGTIVNSASALIPFDRCALAILHRGRLRLGAVSGMAEVNRNDPTVRRTENLLEWTYGGGADLDVSVDDEGNIETERAETREKFHSFFQESGMRSFHADILQDEEGKLGVIGFESAESTAFDENTRSLLQILVNQATVALRNAQLYQQVPLAGFWKPLLESKTRLVERFGTRRRRYAYTALAILTFLFVVPWNVRETGKARLVPSQRIPVSAAVSGVVTAIRHHEGEAVPAGEVIAVLDDAPYRSELARAKADLDIAEGEAARYRAEGDAARLFSAISRRDAAQARITLAEANLGRTLVRAPAGGVIVTPHLENRIGQFLPSGSEVAVLADPGAVTAEIAIPEGNISRIVPGQPVAVKVNAFPMRIFRGRIERLGAEVRQEGDERFLVADARIDDGRDLRAGMLGKAKVSTGRRQLIAVILRGPIRFLWARLWPLLP